MGITWFDLAALVPLAAILTFEVRQEFGRGLLDTLATLIALYFAARLAVPVGWRLDLWTTPNANTALTFCGLFVLLLLLGLLASRFAHRIIRLSVDQFDPLFGVIFGLAIALMAGHALMTAAWEFHGGFLPDYLADSRLGSELLNLHSLRQVVGSMQQMVLNR
jgi:uncharacterized membrane protein required for colicin V production